MNVSEARLRKMRREFAAVTGGERDQATLAEFGVQTESEPDMGTEQKAEVECE